MTVSHSIPSLEKSPLSSKQRGVTLLIALMLLVAMTIAGIVLLRSVDLSNIIAGNLAFKQSATNAADIGIERAFAYLQNNSDNLGTPDLAGGYIAAGSDAENNPVEGESWDDFWNNKLNKMALKTRVRPKVLTDDETHPGDTGNKVSYIIHRMCKEEGSVSSANCTNSTRVSTSTEGIDESDCPPNCPTTSSNIYYRITVRVDGPRNTRSYVQSLVTIGQTK